MSTDVEAAESMLPPAALAEAVAETRERIAALPKTGSAYRTLVDLACIQQEVANRLSRLAYGETQSGRGAKLACKAGCAACCSTIPSEVRGKGVNYYMLTILDIVTLVENYSAIKRRIGDLLDRTTAAVDTARAKGTLVACPYLDRSGACGIYEYRPVACKLWFSATLTHCLRKRSVDWGYPGNGIDPFDRASNRLREEVEAPVMERAEAVLAGAPFGDYDYLTVFHALARLDSRGQLDALKARIDAASQWDPREELPAAAETPP